MKERLTRLDTVADDGSFSMTLVTEGEASDGDILSISGGVIPARMPLLVSHWNDPSATAGSITGAVKELQSSPPALKAKGQIELGGEAAQADIRKDLAFMVKQGHVGAVSIRWDEVEGGKSPVRRVNLPSDHPYYVDGEEEKSFRKRWGLFWPEWRALEGSIVALGADPKALIGRALETEGEVRVFWREMADSVPPDPVEQIRRLAVQCLEDGLEQSDLFNAVHASELSASNFEVIQIDDRSFFLPAELAERVQVLREEVVELETVPDEIPERVAPLALDITQLHKPLDTQQIIDAITESIVAADDRRLGNIQTLLNRVTGKVM